MDEVKTRLQLLATETGTDATKLAEDLSKGGTLASVAGLERQRLLVNLTPVAAVLCEQYLIRELAQAYLISNAAVETILPILRSQPDAGIWPQRLVKAV